MPKELIPLVRTDTRFNDTYALTSLRNGELNCVNDFKVLKKLIVLDLDGNDVDLVPQNVSDIDGQVLTSNGDGRVYWITPAVGVYSFVYPYPTSVKTGTLSVSTITYCNTYTMTSNITFSNASMFLYQAGSDFSRVGIYRGDLTTAILVGQTDKSPPTSDYYTRTLTAIGGESLTFSVGEQIVVAYTKNGSTTSIVSTTGVSNLALACVSNIGYSTGFPSSISGIAAPSATPIRVCIDFS